MKSTTEDELPRLEEAVLTMVMAMVAHVLEVESVRPTDDFFADLGGDSLRAVVLADTVEAAFGQDVIEQIFAAPEIAALAAAVAEAVRSEPPSGYCNPTALPLELQRRVRAVFAAARRDGVELPHAPGATMDEAGDRGP